MIGNNMLANVILASEKILNIGFDLENRYENTMIEETMIIEPGRAPGGDDGATY